MHPPGHRDRRPGVREEHPRGILVEDRLPAPVIAVEHPVFDTGAIAAQRHVHGLGAGSPLRFCGAWTGYGFHEDGLRSGQAAAAALLDHLERVEDGRRMAA